MPILRVWLLLLETLECLSSETGILISSTFIECLIVKLTHGLTLLGFEALLMFSFFLIFSSQQAAEF